MTPDRAGPSPALADGVLDDIDRALAATDTFLADSYPGEDGRRQPVHTVYVPADQYDPDLPARWGRSALDLVEEHGGMAAVCAELGMTDDLAAQVADRVVAKLTSSPIEDLRLDFEDGYGDRGQETEDADSVAAAAAVSAAVSAGVAPAFIGIRFKCFEAPTRRRGIRTLDLFVGGLLERLGELPPGLVLTFPKVSTVSQVEAMVATCRALESTHGLADRTLGFEIQVETPQLILGADGTAPLAAAIHAGDHRVTSLHYGTYDYSASLQISAEYQSADHPVADHAKQVMQLAAAGTGVHLCDGSTNILPIGGPHEVRAAWKTHHDLVGRALRRGFYQGWDLHPGQLPTRYVATFAFYRKGLPKAARRLADYLGNSASGVLDEPATARALARYLHRGHACGAVDESELIDLVGLTGGQLDLLSRPRSDTESTRRRS
ncbi:MAG: HpcH/HpaI aldolase/citrate lyase family protein [Actinomycetota bacterium]|nr:HpcH/HpaI aldolase/citrate lyase family protein [Actinomycetota bacterium]